MVACRLQRVFAAFIPIPTRRRVPPSRRDNVNDLEYLFVQALRVTTIPLKGKFMNGRRTKVSGEHPRRHYFLIDPS